MQNQVQLLGSGRFRVDRGPRRRPPAVPSGEIVAAPPRSAPPASGGWPLFLLPALGGIGSLPLLLSSTGSGRRWLLLGTGGSLLLSALAGLGTRLLGRRSARRARRVEVSRYRTHLDEARARAAEAAASQRAAAEHLHPDLDRLARMLDDGRIWERSPPDADFLAVRVGRGPVPLATRLSLDLGRDPLADHDPELLRAATALVARSARVDDLPVTVPLRGAGVVTVRGPRAAARSLVRGMLLRCAVAHAPEDLRILAVFTPDAVPDWAWLKWLPHARTGLAAIPGELEVPSCRLAASASAAAGLIEREVRPRVRVLATAGEGGSGCGASLPHLLLVIDGYVPGGRLGRVEIVDELLRGAPELGATVLWLAERSAGEPPAARWTVEVDGDGGLAVRETGPVGRVQAGVRVDAASPAFSEALARRLAPLWLALPGPVRAAMAARVMALEGRRSACSTCSTCWGSVVVRASTVVGSPGSGASRRRPRDFEFRSGVASRLPVAAGRRPASIPASMPPWMAPSSSTSRRRLRAAWARTAC
jgi:S-DNA-T family DNA segregation ATPase FtsK/SpoIIIE